MALSNVDLCADGNATCWWWTGDIVLPSCRPSVGCPQGVCSIRHTFCPWLLHTFSHVRGIPPNLDSLFSSSLIILWASLRRTKTLFMFLHTHSVKSQTWKVKHPLTYFLQNKLCSDLCSDHSSKGDIWQKAPGVLVVLIRYCLWMYTRSISPSINTPLVEIYFIM